MNVLSLFDGMSCGQLALQRAGFEVDIYMACEIDKYGMQVTRKNFPNTIQMGDVCDLRGENLPPIDLMLFGSPCQGFSFAGKQLNFKDPRSALFFQAVRLIRETKPKYFLMENVRMKQEYQDVISEHLGVKPVKINSALVSAQNRVRLYWTNIPNITQPEDKGIVLKDILEDGVSDTFDSGKKKGGGQHNNMLNTDYKSQANTIHDVSRKSPTICAGTHGYALGHIERPCETGSGGHANKYLIHKPVKVGNIYPSGGQNGNIYHADGKSPTLSAGQGIKGSGIGSNNAPKVLVIKEATKKGYTEIQDGDCFDNTFPTSKTRRGRNMKDKSNCLTAANYEYMRYEHPTYRKLTPMECMRLQTVPDHYFDDAGISNTQIYKLLGNGWTVDIICHIFEGIKAEFIQKQDEKVA